MPLTIDRSEFHEARWWDISELSGITPSDEFDPHLHRFVAKLSAQLGR